MLPVTAAPSENMLPSIYSAYLCRLSTTAEARSPALEMETVEPLAPAQEMPMVLQQLHPQTIATSSNRINFQSFEEEQQRFKEDLVQFQTQCSHPLISGMIQYLLALRQENQQLRVEKAEAQQVLADHSEGVLKDIAKGLYKVIRDSPRLKAKMESRLAALEDDDHSNVELASFLRKLETEVVTASDRPRAITQNKISDGWLCLVPGQQAIEIDVDSIALEEMQRHIAILERATHAQGKGDMKSLQISMKEIRAETKSKAHPNWNKTMKSVGSWSFFTLKGLLWVSSLAVSAVPTAMAILPIILPIKCLQAIKFLIDVFL